jgi:hypothetical protein
MLDIFLTKKIYIKSIWYHILSAFVLIVVLGYPQPSSPPLPRIIESCLYLILYASGIMHFTRRDYKFRQIWTQFLS